MNFILNLSKSRKIKTSFLFFLLLYFVALVLEPFVFNSLYLLSFLAFSVILIVLHAFYKFVVINVIDEVLDHVMAVFVFRLLKKSSIKELEVLKLEDKKYLFDKSKFISNEKTKFVIKGQNQ